MVSLNDWVEKTEKPLNTILGADKFFWRNYAGRQIVASFAVHTALHDINPTPGLNGSSVFLQQEYDRNNMGLLFADEGIAHLYRVFVCEDSQQCEFTSTHIFIPEFIQLLESIVLSAYGIALQQTELSLEQLREKYTNDKRTPRIRDVIATTRENYGTLFPELVQYGLTE